MLAWWLVAAASGPAAYDGFRDFAGSVVGRLLLLGWSFALFYHLCNGIRHLFWDIGRYFELTETRRADVFVLIGAVALTGPRKASSFQ